MTLFTVNLVYRNSRLRDQRIEVPKGQFHFGRHPSSDLFLEGNSVSRTHGMIVRHAEKVLIQDLGSRNGTKVNSERLGKGEQVTLSHGDKIQIGEWKFRISIREQQTVEPLVAGQPTPVNGGILAELDSLFLELDESAPKLTHASSQLLAKVDRDRQAQHQSDPTQTTIREVISDEEGTSIQAPVESKQVETNLANNTAKQSDVQDTTQADEPKPDAVEKKPKYQKLPAHLRPQNPSTSHDAAEQALRRMFGGQ